MTDTYRRAAIVLWLATVGGGIVLAGAWASHQRLFAENAWTIAFGGLLALVAHTFSSSGLLLAFRQPRILIGWILLLIGPLICVTFSGFALGAVLTTQRGQDDLLAGSSTSTSSSRGWLAS
jgi:hypothetical protein